MKNDDTIFKEGLNENTRCKVPAYINDCENLNYIKNKNTFVSQSCTQCCAYFSFTLIIIEVQTLEITMGIYSGETPDGYSW